MPFSHRPTLKQANKKFKSGHASKGALRRKNDASGSRTHKGNPLRAAGNSDGSRSNRRNEARQSAQQKRAALVDSARVFHGSGLRGEARGAGKAGAPRICAVVTLTPDGDPWGTVRALEDEVEALGVAPVAGRSVGEALSEHLPFCELEATRFRQTLQFLPLPYGALLPAMDACRAADFVILLLSADQSIEAGSWGELCLRTLQAQGLPQVLAAVPTLRTADEQPWASRVTKKASAQRDAQGVRKSLLGFVQYFCPDVKKVQVLDEAADRSLLLRTLATTAPRRVAWRDFRPWLVCEGAQWMPTHPHDTLGELRVQGWIRGAPLSASRLVHIPDFGDYAVDRITAAPLTRTRRTPVARDADDVAMGDDALDESAHELDVRDEEHADELVSENEPDPLANEQTWPTEEEMAAADAPAHPDAAPPPAAPGTTPKEVLKANADENARRRYQAAWIVESGGEEGGESAGESAGEEGQESDGESDGKSDGEESAAEQDDDAMGVEKEADAVGAHGDGAHAPEPPPADDYDDAAEEAALAAYREQRVAERATRRDETRERQFPDEVDTPMDMPARQRFARYRGLESMYTTHWDPYEDLPADYARLFQFDDFRRTRKSVESNAMLEGVRPGARVCVWIRNVPRAAGERAMRVAHDGKMQQQVPFVIFGLLRHEHKKSVVNFSVSRNTEYEAPVRSKDPLVVCLGFRRYAARPVWSQHVRNTGRRGNNVHKFERYLPHGIGAAVGSVYAPVTFGGASVPVVLLRMRAEDQESGYDATGVSAEQTPHLVGAGSVLDIAPTRIIAKRIVLSGHPYKMHKKTATIRFMFFNAGDVRYFAPITLRTKYGRTGHISESLGTHGYFKDTILLHLYKRVYPRWSDVFRGSRDGMPLVAGSGAKEEGTADAPSM
ncbi:ribosome biogenesis protein tsr1 [Malassezia sp. CBS 17886]|nr:ribosome biogenesis protein tsr1 [Malassezia sp. CBS 17886]